MAATLAEDVVTMETREASPTHFLIKIESFYKSGIDKYETKEFVAGEYKWRLIIYPNGDKIGKDCNYVSVYLAMADDTNSLPERWEVNVVFNIFLFNQIAANYLCSLGRTRRFLAMKAQWGFSKFISKKVLSDTSNGYLVDDNCVFGAEVFVLNREPNIVKKQECLSLKNAAIPYKREWKISEFSKLGHVWMSEEFSAAGQRWTISLYPKGNLRGAGSHVSIYLRLVGSERVQACFTALVKNQVNDDEQDSRTSSRWFSPPYTDEWGWPSFMELEYMNDPKRGLIVNDCCVIAVELSCV
ncbi:hypothetical protein ABFX02_07G096900 [Erythranthe guttata]